MGILRKNTFFGKIQYGFIKNKSFRVNLSTIFNSDQFRNSMDIVYFDFSKAFNKVSLEILVEKVTKD